MYQYDIAVLGAGCAGWQLLQQLSLQPNWADCKVLLLDDGTEKQQSWSFWSAGNHPLQQLVTKSWQQLSFCSAKFSTKQSAKPYTYHHIPGKVFFNYFEQQFLPQNPNITLVKAKVNRIHNQENCFLIDTDQQSFRAKNCYSSINPQTKKPELWQHFKGWYIETKEEIFDDRTAMLMDYTTQLHQEVHFIYVLPFTKNRALVEATFFSAEVVSDALYEELIKAYLQQHFPQINYKITSAETGQIPMSRQQFNHYGPAGETLIGKAAGMVKASTGYAFNRITNDSILLAKNIGQKQYAVATGTRGRFRFYDALLLNMIRHSPQIIPNVFTQLFKHNRMPDVLRFLDEQSTLQQEIRIFASLPILPFLKQAIKHIFTYRDGK